LWARDAASLVVSAAYDAVTTRLFALPDDTVVYPGHDYRGKTRSTIGAEKRTNLRFAGKTRHEYIELMAQLGLPFPEQVQRALQVNQAGFEETEVCFPLMADMAALHALVASELVERLASATPPLVLDVREPEEFVGELGHIAGSLLVPMDALAQRLPKLIGYVERDVVVVCRAGARSASAGAMLRRAGFPHVFNLRGGMLAWATSGLPVMR
jgi:rhodanese-related sulfurtransferase